MRGAVTHPDAIQRQRKLLGLTQEDLADRAGCDVKTIRKAEQGKNLGLLRDARGQAVLRTRFRRLRN
jgi:transcriptional regulator with XRE-family HTH domain